MPIYTYECSECEVVEDDVFVSTISNEENERPDCSDCGEEMSKAVSGNYLIHYGTDGFYQTDENGKDYQ